MSTPRPPAAGALTAPRRLTSAALRHLPLPQPDGNADKETRGRVLVVGGSREIPGAALLAATAALRAGAGKVAVATAASVAVPLAMALPEARVIGLDETVVVLDAYAMSVVRGADALRLGPNRVLTPHAGEMAHLTGRDKRELERDRLDVALRTARDWNACVAFKGAETAVALPDGTLWLHRGGNAGLGTSGSGDTLAGLIGGLAARGVPALHAALWGVRLHALAGEALAAKHGELGFLAREIPDEVPRAMQALCGPQPDGGDDAAAGWP